MKNNTYKKILLVNPPSESKTPVLPLGLASIAAYLKSKNKEINLSVIDAWAENLNLSGLEKRIAETQADIIGVYMPSPRYGETKTTIETCRKALPGATIIAGGPHASAAPIETLNDIPQLDICAIGEGETIMDELIRGCPLSNINGIAYRDGKEIKSTPPRAFIKNLDELPFPARDLFPLDKYIPPAPLGRKSPCFIMVTSRGCPFQCSFCSKEVFKDTYRSQSPKRVCDEIEELILKYRAREIPFLEDNFTLDTKRAEEICDEILRRRLKFSWSCQARVTSINEAILKKMKKAGCWHISFGVESGSQKILDLIDKGITVEKITSAFKIAKKAGLMTSCSFIFGLPGETKETIKETVDLAKKLKPDFIGWGILTVYPGSRLFKSIKSGKYRGKLRVLKETQNIPGTFFRGDRLAFEQNFTFEELREISWKTIKEFYLRPQFIIQSLRNIRSFSDLNYLVRGGIKVIKSLTE